MMIVGVLGDVHGNIDLAYKAIVRWQKKNEKIMDLLLQVGDMGVYDPQKEITTKRRIIRQNPGELNLTNYLNNPDTYKHYHVQGSSEFERVEANLFFTRGNHDDATYLKSLEEKADNHSNTHHLGNQMHYMSDSMPVTFYSEDGEHLTVAALGGIDSSSRPGKHRKDPTIAINEDAIVRALTLSEKLDIFMSHMHPDRAREDGSRDLTDLIEEIQPKYYFFGHLHMQSPPFMIGRTMCYGLDNVNHLHNKRYESGFMAVLHVENGRITKLL